MPIRFRKINKKLVPVDVFLTEKQEKLLLKNIEAKKQEKTDAKENEQNRTPISEPCQTISATEN